MRLIFWLKLLTAKSSLLIAGIMVLLACAPAINGLKFSQTQQFFNSFGGGNYRPIYLLIGLAATQIADQLLARTKEHMQQRFSLRISHILDFYLLNLIQQVRTITTLESPKYRNDLNLLKNKISQVSFLVQSIIGLLFQLTHIVIYAYLIIPYSWLVVLATLLFSLPSLLYTMKQVNRNEHYLNDSSQLQLETSNMYGLLTHPYIQKELIIFKARSYMLHKWIQASLSSIRRKIKLLNKDFSYGLLLDWIHPAGFLLVQIVLALKIMSNTITIGDYVAVTAAAAMLDSSFRSFWLGMHTFKSFGLFIQTLDQFRSEYLPQNASSALTPCGPIEQISSCGLSFRYPEQRKDVLSNINITIAKGQVIVIVGENGSGKSTLAKLMMGVHDVPDGMLFINGHDINGIDRPSLFEHISVVNQDYVRYPLSVLENIAMREPDDAEMARVQSYMQKYPMLIPEMLADHLDEVIGGEYLHSRQLSGGQWQRIAIARALFRQSSFLLLDEATSELDPETEMEIINKLLQERAGKTTLIVTHNLHLATRADQIIVLHKGQLVEQGTHLELLEQHGKYYAMWNSQNEGEKRLA